MTSKELLRQLDREPAANDHASTGIEALDELTCGPSPGQVWVITSVPSQGRTTLLTQLADALSVEHAWPTLLICPQEDPRTVAARLTSLRSRVVLWDLTRGRATGSDSLIRREQLTALEDAPLHIVARGHRDPLSVVGEIEADPPRALLVDDIHQVAGASSTRLRSLADAGAFIAATLPRRLVVTSDAVGPHLEHEWADIADVILEVRQATWPASNGLRPGEADLSALKNRWGPCRTLAVASQPHYSRFVDLPT